MSLGGLQIPPYLPLGTSPLVLQPVPEPTSMLLVVFGLAAVTFCFPTKKPGDGESLAG